MFSRLQAALEKVHTELAGVLDAGVIRAICRDLGHRFRTRVLDPVATIHLFVLQVLKGNVAIARLKDFSDRVFTAAAYCNARTRLPLTVLQRLLQRVGQAMHNTVDDASRWLGHRTFLLDGSSFSMPDTPALQKAFGQHGSQQAGCGFPIAHLLTLFHAGTGILLEAFAAPLRTHDLAHAALTHAALRAGDILVGDRAFGSFAHLALLLGRGLHGVFRAHQKQIVDFTPRRPHNVKGCKPSKGLPTSRWLQQLGFKDQLVEYAKPKIGPAWLTAAAYAALPETLVVRELWYRVERRGSRTKTVTLVTTLLDAERYPVPALAALYGQRWTIETNLRHLKQTMKLEVLHCETPDGVLKELTVYALVYNLVRAVMCAAAERQQVPVERLSFADALG
jgi:hypothetical protein